MTELEKAARMALEQLEFLNACYPHKTAADTITALTQALATTERKLVATPDHNGALVPASPADMQVYNKIAAGYWTERKREPVATVRTIRGVTIGYLETRLPDGTSLYASPQVPEDVRKDAERYRKIRQGSTWPCAFASHDAPEPLTGDDLDAALDAARKGE